MIVITVADDRNEFRNSSLRLPLLSYPTPRFFAEALDKAINEHGSQQQEEQHQQQQKRSEGDGDSMVHQMYASVAEMKKAKVKELEKWGEEVRRRRRQDD